MMGTLTDTAAPILIIMSLAGCNSEKALGLKEREEEREWGKMWNKGRNGN